ncbi:uncharacterized protein LOC133391548 [Anopheles gambiae]|uniref:uncharacterized protein LOC133391548 n=1 Tax=Anopheles gambiae TaxID=7165 RepID=UPI002AC920EC|nr:uncharacterized protein LOC133391548 [Anopheles gambiae]
MNHLFMNGLVIGTRFYWVASRAIIADAPARAFIKGVKGYNAYSGCQKCTIVGELHGRRMYFAYDAERQPRKHSDFCDGKYPTHVNKRTPLTRLLGCDIEADFVSAEDMHLLYKGVEAKLIDLWIKGFPGVPCYLPHRQQRQVSAHLRLFKLSTDYQRKLRDLRYVQLCKAREYRMFLLVSGFVILEGVDLTMQHTNTSCC